MRGSFRLGNVFGIEIDINYTWLIVFVLVTWSLAAGFFPQEFPGWPISTYWLVGVIASLLLFASVLLHELAHSLVAQREGLPITNITLFIFGGVSNIQREPTNPKDEFRMAFVGPLSSIFIGVFTWVLLVIFGSVNVQLQAVLLYLTIINLMLAAFNLIPAFPLDGGRVFRSIVWWATHSLTRATRIASAVGQGFGYLIIFVGLLLLFTGNFLGGVWLVLIGWFLTYAAESSYRQLVVQETLRGIPVRDMMAQDVPTVTPNVTVRELVDRYILPRNIRALPVVHDSQLVGMVTLSDVQHVSQEEWDTTDVGRIMTPRERLHALAPQDDAVQALEAMGEQDVNQLPVVSDGKVVGLVTRGHIIRLLQVRQDLGARR
ncbi:MAG: site-2 protease family protein [Chloroflexi bacterium]|nr:site-2 protease family protein [Chloroflexota bacterium]MDA8188890.1 site-2 protease family protein [Dehalococcoidales bacterium]